MNYDKKPFKSTEHLELLKKRGLLIPNQDRALRYLENISYFRLSGYMFHHQKNDGSHRFHPETSFDDIIDEYHFDKKLRLLILEYIERIEIALRAQLSNKYCINHGFFWYTKKNLFQDINVYHQINDYIIDYFRDPPDLFLKKFKNKYSSESVPPSNMAFEILTLGKTSRLFSGLKNDREKQDISEHFNLPSTILSSWFLYLTNIRNICAHHSRLWNKSITADRPQIPSRKKYQFHGELPSNFNSKLYGVLSIIERLLRPINTTNSFIDNFIILIDEYPRININHMGLAENWKKEPAWK